MSTFGPAATTIERNLASSGIRAASMHLLPLLAVAFAFSHIDRVNISFAALQMNHDLHFSASIYGFGAGIFFLGYALFQVPSNLLLVSFGARRWLALILFVWGLLSISMMLIRTPMQFYVVRFLLGVAEAGFYPGVIFYLTRWFPAEERARAISRFYLAVPFSSVVMGALAGFLLGLEGHLGLAGWQWLFLVEGVPSVLLSLVFLLRLPENPDNAVWLTPSERDCIVARLQQERAAMPVSPGDSISAFLKQPAFWFMSCYYFCALGSGYSLNLTAPAIVKQLTGFNATNIGLLLSAINLIAAAAMIANGSHSDRAGERYLHIAVPFVLITTGFFLSGLSTRAWIAVPALSMVIISFIAVTGPVWALPSTFLCGRSSAPGIAAVNGIGMLGTFISPYCMGILRDRTGNYRGGLLLSAILSLLAMLIILRMRHVAHTSGTAGHARCS